MNVALVGQRIQRVRDLSGFKLLHRIPDQVNDLSEAFVARIAIEQMDADLDTIYGDLRTQFRLKRGDLIVSKPADGTGAIATPYFEYAVTVSLNSSDPSQVVWRREVSEIRDTGKILADPFAAVFGRMFNTVELSPARAINLEALIDRIEDLNDPQLTLNYDQDITWCNLSITGIAGEMAVTAQSLSLVQRNPESPRHLLQSFLDFQTALIETYDVGVIASNAT